MSNANAVIYHAKQILTNVDGMCDEVSKTPIIASHQQSDPIPFDAIEWDVLIGKSSTAKRCIRTTPVCMMHKYIAQCADIHSYISLYKF